MRLRVTRQERFAREVAALSPLATAYREAGYGGDPRWHAYNASKLANRSRVKARIDELREQFEQMSAIHVDYIRHQLLKIVEADVRDLYERDSTDPTGKKLRLRSIAELPGYLSRAIARLKIDPENGALTEVILASKTEASATLLRSLPAAADRSGTELLGVDRIERVIVETRRESNASKNSELAARLMNPSGNDHE
jgi:Terminase small subunit